MLPRASYHTQSSAVAVETHITPPHDATTMGLPITSYQLQPWISPTMAHCHWIFKSLLPTNLGLSHTYYDMFPLGRFFRGLSALLVFIQHGILLGSFIRFDYTTQLDVRSFQRQYFDAAIITITIFQRQYDNTNHNHQPHAYRWVSSSAMDFNGGFSSLILLPC